MKKLLTYSFGKRMLVAALFIGFARLMAFADVGETFFWKAEETTPISANSFILNDNLLSLSTVYATTLVKRSVSFGGESFTHYVQLCVNEAPTVDVPTGTEHSESTPFVLVAKKDLYTTFYFHREQGVNGFLANDNKDLLIIDQSEVSVLLEGEEVIEDDSEVYAYTTKTYKLEAGHTYTVFRVGPTIEFYGLKYCEIIPWPEISIDYENETTPDWTTATVERYTPILADDGNGDHYLTVNQDQRENNGTTLRSNSLKGIVPKGENFTLQFDIRLGNVYNYTELPSFTIYDSDDNAAIFSLTAVETNTAMWKINGTPKIVELPNSGDVRNKTIEDISWCTVKLTRSGKLTFLSIVDKASGNDIYPLGLIYGSSKLGGLGKMEFITKRIWANFAIDNIVLRHVKDDDIPEVEETTCTLHFTNESGTTIKEDTVISTIVGIEFELESDLTSSFLTDDGTIKYIFKESSNSIITSEDASKNEITLVYREAAKWNYTLKAVDENGNLLKVLNIGQSFEQEELLIPYSAYISHNGKIWHTDPQQSIAYRLQYRMPFEIIDGDVIQSVVYQPLYDNAVFIAEAEDIPGLTLCNNPNMVVRNSNSACAFAAEKTAITTLPSGEYEIHAGSSVSGSINLLTIYCGDKVQLDMTTKNTNLYENSTTVWTDRPIVISFEGGKASAGLDFIFIVKTADVEDVTIPLDLSTEEWALLKTAYETMDNTEIWNRKWNVNTETPTAVDLPGVNCIDGHIVAIDLSANNLTGNFPFAFLALPELQSLNVSGNSLIGDITVGMTTIQQAMAESKLKSLNISSNELTGNLAVFANALPSLTTLYADNNCLTDIYPEIASTVTTLSYDRQQTGVEMDFHIGEMTTSVFLDRLPTLLLYDHSAQTWHQEIGFYATDGNGFGINLYYSNGKLKANGDYNKSVYYGQSGDVLDAQTVNSAHTLRVKMTFDQGDSNFDGQVNVLDLQSDINYIMESYLQSSLYNFTAANLWEDEVINVQDIICQVNLLMNMDSADAVRTANARIYSPIPNAVTPDAEVYVQDNQLVLNTVLPVAAFDIVVCGASSMTIARSLELAGMIVSTKVMRDGLHIIGYALNGARIPTGTSTIGTLDARASVRRAMLADSEANAVSVSIGGTTTGINDIETGKMKNEDAVYDLQGRNVSVPHKGLFIQNGRKVLK